MPIESVSFWPLQSVGNVTSWVSSVDAKASLVPNGDLPKFAAPSVALPTEDTTLQSLMRDWVLLSLTAAPTSAPVYASSGLPLGGGPALESLASAYDYDNFAGDSGETRSFETADGQVFTGQELNLLI